MSASPHPYADLFTKVLPYYMSIGMTPDEFWNGDNALPKYYREAQGLRNARLNQQLWLQGMYIYEALCDVSPILRAFGKKGVKPHPYPEQPFAITKEEIKEKAEAEDKKVYEKGMAKMEAFMKSFNKRLSENPKEVSADAEH